VTFGILKTYRERWGLEADGKPLSTSSSDLLFAWRGNEQCVLKIPRSADEVRGAAVLDRYKGNCAVRLLEADSSGAQLLERAIPGTPLTELVLRRDDALATDILCSIAEALHAAVPPPGIPAVEKWGEGFQRCKRTGASVIPDDFLTLAERRFTELADSQSRVRLLHRDLHHDNILFDNDRGWLAIDPKGVIGEPEYEFGAMLRNPTDDPSRFADPAIILARVAAISANTGLDSDRLLGWAFSQAVLSAIWSIEDGEDPIRGLATARAVLPLL
jgi:streptomycin 6-kinase